MPKKKPHNDATLKHLETLATHAMALDTIFACGGAVDVAAPMVLKGPKRQSAIIIEEPSLRRSNVDQKLWKWCAPAGFGDGDVTREDPRVRDGRQLYARDGALSVEGFDESLGHILSAVRASPTPHDAHPPTAELHSLNLYKRGGHFVAHKDTPRDPDVFGTLVVCLPLEFSGGCLVIEHVSRATFDWARIFNRARWSHQKKTGRVFWAAFFGDVDHRIETVTSGCRATLTYELRRGHRTNAAESHTPSDAEAAFSAALDGPLADPDFFPGGGTLGVPCLHLYTLTSEESARTSLPGLYDRLKGRDRHIAAGLERAGLVHRVVPYIYETCAGDNWRLRREVSPREKEMFQRARLDTFDLEKALPIELHPDWNQSDDVTWVMRPPWMSPSTDVPDGRPEPEVGLLGEPEFSATGYFGNEGCDTSFYAAAAILFDVPAKAKRRRA